MVSTVEGMVIEVRPLQWLKAPSLMTVTDEGMETEVRLVQEWKALAPMEMT